MATNATDTAVDDSKPVTEEDLRNDKLAAEVETVKAEDETTTDETSTEESEETSEEDGQTDDQTEEEQSTEEAPVFVKQVPSIVGDTEEEYRKNLETAYQQSTAEALRLKGENDVLKTTDASETPETTEPVDPRLLYLDKLLNKDIQTAFAEFKKSYPQVDDPAEYAKFTTEATALSNYYQSKNQILTGEDLYPKVAAILGWQKESAPDSKDKLGMALKDKGATSKTTSSAAAIPTKSKVTAEMIAANKLMYPNKSEDEIRKELEPYVK